MEKVQQTRTPITSGLPKSSLTGGRPFSVRQFQHQPGCSGSGHLLPLLPRSCQWPCPNPRRLQGFPEGQGHGRAATGQGLGMVSQRTSASGSHRLGALAGPQSQIQA